MHHARNSGSPPLPVTDVILGSFSVDFFINKLNKPQNQQFDEKNVKSLHHILISLHFHTNKELMLHKFTAISCGFILKDGFRDVNDTLVIWPHE
jgi:hypothetical protein